MLWKLKISNSIHCINFPVEILHCFDCSLIWNLTCSMNPKAAFKNQDSELLETSSESIEWKKTK